MIVDGVSFRSAVVAGLGAGYAMAFFGVWIDGVLGLPRVDLRDFGAIYLGERGPSSFWVGALAHVAESILLAVAYAALFFHRLPGPPFLRGLQFGLLLWIAGILSTVVGARLGGRVFQRYQLNRGYLIVNFGQHVVFGVLLGALYTVG